MRHEFGVSVIDVDFERQVYPYGKQETLSTLGGYNVNVIMLTGYNFEEHVDRTRGTPIIDVF